VKVVVECARYFADESFSCCLCVSEGTVLVSSEKPMVVELLSEISPSGAWVTSNREGWACFPTSIGVGGVLDGDVALGICERFYPPSGVVWGPVPAPVIGSPFPLVFDRSQIRSSFLCGRAPDLLYWGSVCGC